MITLDEVKNNPTDPIVAEDEEEGWREIPERVCLECGEPLDEDYDYEICERCLEGGAACHHGVPYTEVCNRCCTESDFAFDANRERGWR